MDPSLIHYTGQGKSIKDMYFCQQANKQYNFYWQSITDISTYRLKAKNTQT